MTVHTNQSSRDFILDEHGRFHDLRGKFVSDDVVSSFADDYRREAEKLYRMIAESEQIKEDIEATVQV